MEELLNDFAGGKGRERRGTKTAKVKTRMGSFHHPIIGKPLDHKTRRGPKEKENKGGGKEKDRRRGKTHLVFSYVRGRKEKMTSEGKGKKERTLVCLSDGKREEEGEGTKKEKQVSRRMVGITT